MENVDKNSNVSNSTPVSGSDRSATPPGESNPPSFQLRMIGLSHRSAPIEIRERFSFKANEVVEKLRQWIQKFGENEAVLLSTCNRTEFYFASQNGELPDDATVFAFLARNDELFARSDYLEPRDLSCDEANAENVADANEPPIAENEPSRARSASNRSSSNRFDSARDCFLRLSNREAIEHLFSVVSSLDSMVLGEPQILSQVKTAYQIAADNGSTGPITHSAFQTALRVAKRISVETGVFQRRVSVPSVAVVDFALQIFERLGDKKTLILGAGEMAEETLKYLTDNGAKSIVVINRNRSRAETLASQWNGSVFDWDDRVKILGESDIVVAATGATEPIITLDDYRSVVAARSGRPLFVLDLSLPRNVDPKLGDCPDVYLYSIDDLKEACERNRRSRNSEIPKAQKIVRQETELFLQEMERRSFKDVIRRLRETWNEIKESELERLLNRLPDLDEKSESEIRYAFDRLVNKLLHPPMESLRDESKSGSSPGRFLEFFKRLFGL